MRKVLASLLVVLFVAVGLAAQEKAAGEKKKEPARWHGTIIRSDKQGSTFTVRQRGGPIERVIHYTSATKWTNHSKPADPSEFKDGSRVICLGNYEGKNFVATQIDLREPAR